MENKRNFWHLIKEKKITRGKESVSKDILENVKEKVDRVNIVSYFYNTSIIFLDSIKYCIENGKSVLYITNEKQDRIEILKYLEKKNYIYLDDNGKEVRGKLNLADYNRSLYLEYKYDLVIYDELGYMPSQNGRSIELILLKLVSQFGTAISYSVESVFEKADTIYFPYNEKNIPLIEPRVISTKINMKNDLPLVAYDYLIWSVQSNKKTIIYVPDSVRVINVYRYIYEIRDKIITDIFYYINGKKDKSSIKKFLESQNGIIITNDYHESYDDELDNLNVMVFFADDYFFNYKKLIYITSKVERIRSNFKKEVIFLCKEETKDIEKAKSIMRNLNKKGWEDGFLKL
ncbi:hypothetical protein [Clostridium ihumii]|uniref:hypothetical protein n=1 Tax=Clostridium ihumii TaxID=1470356 RepID=UPI000687E51B|nr:hypothetical protein [Clostridium ihumii]